VHYLGTSVDLYLKHGSINTVRLNLAISSVTLESILMKQYFHLSKLQERSFASKRGPAVNSE